MNYIFIFRRRRLCEVRTQSERIGTHLSSVVGTLFCEVVRRLEKTQWGADRSAWVASGSPTSLERPADLSSSLERPVDLCLQSKITDLILSFQVSCWSMNILFTSRIFYLWLIIGTYILPFFPVICWFYLWTEISVTLSIGNKLYSSPSCFLFSFLWNHFVDVILRPHWIC